MNIINNLDKEIETAKQKIENLICNNHGILFIKSDGTPQGTTCTINGISIDNIERITILPIEPCKPVRVQIDILMPRLHLNGSAEIIDETINFKYS